MSAAPSWKARLDVLDGWRGVSILLVLAAHLLPLGPKQVQLNLMAGPMGMALFFTLSGFLITRFLLHHASIGDFLIRRIFRIVPLAWIGISVALILDNPAAADYAPNFLFYANLPPQHLTDSGSHFWSLCIEMQFYVAVALLVWLSGRRGLYVLPILCVGVTIHRIWVTAPVDIVTWRRADEILAGVTLALVYEGRMGIRPVQLLQRTNAYLLLALLAVCSHPAFEFMNYLRPYVAAMLVGTTLFSAPPVLGRLLRSRWLAYVAEVSFALYVVHHLLAFTWLGSGEKWVKYAKRPLLFAATFLLAHISTFHFERPCIALGRRLSALLQSRGGKAPTSASQ